MWRGFYGPGQAWQPWGDPRWYAPQPQPQQQPGQQLAQAQETEPASPQGQESGASHASTPTPTTGVNTDANTADAGSEPSTRARSASPDERPIDPRAAAAVAALRRRQIPSASGPSASTPAAAESSARSTSVASALQLPTEGTTTPSTSAATPSIPPHSTSSAPSSSSSAPPESQPQPPGQGASTSTSAGASPSSAVLPPLIPLYDPSIMQPTHAPVVPPFYAQYNHYFRAPGARPPYPTPTEQTAPSRRAHQRPATSTARAPLSQLPPTLTDEQLARLDRLTREAIDERLRVLEGVSGAIYRCVEELTRVRSVLPPSSSSSASATASAPRRGAEAEASGSGSAPSEGEEGSHSGSGFGSGSSEEGELVDAPEREGETSGATAVEVSQ